MKFELINQELSEAKLYRSSRQFGALDGSTVADLLYLNTLILTLMYETPSMREEAVEYAKKTSQYGSYALFRSFATDLYMLAYQVAHPNNDHAKLRNETDSKKFLNNLNFNERRHLAFVRKMAQEHMSDIEAHTFLHRLETQLRIKDSRYKTWRRKVLAWEKASESEKKRLYRMIQTEFNRLGQGTARRSELLIPLKDYAPAKIAAPRKKSNTGAKIAGVAAGALAGRYAAGKLSGMDKDRAKNIGTGIGAIAGFWAGGRKAK